MDCMYCDSTSLDHDCDEVNRRRREATAHITYDEHGWPIHRDTKKRLSNSDLYANMPMYFPCATKGCPRPVVMHEGYTPPRDKFCHDCA